MRTARVGEFTEATECDSGDYDFDESATVHPLESNISGYLRPGVAVRALSASAAYASGDLELDPKAHTFSITGLE